MSLNSDHNSNNGALRLRAASSLSKENRINWLKEENQPSYLYKYHPFTNQDHTKDIVCKSQLHLNSADKLNDPFELRWKTTISKNLDDRIRKYMELSEQHPDQFPADPYQKNIEILAKALDTDLANKTADLLNNLRQNKHGITSFGDSPYNILMWAHYANNHKGCVFEFEVADDVEVFASTISIKYSDNYPVVEWTSTENNPLKSAIFTKYSQWSYENERRILRVNQADSDLPFKQEALSKIFLGCRFSKENRKMLDFMINKRQEKGWRIPEIIYTEIDKESYKLIPV